jgi:hypothetical protein
MNHRDASIFQAYLNERVRCDVQAAFLGRPSAGALIKGADASAGSGRLRNDVTLLSPDGEWPVNAPFGLIVYSVSGTPQEMYNQQISSF